jgi:hypothetical protein
VNCSNCGAPLNSAARDGFIVCEHCGSSTPTADAALIADLAQVDQWWYRERQRFVRVDRHGTVHPPEKEHPIHIVFMVLGGGLGLITGMSGFLANWELAGLAFFFLPIILITFPAAMFHERHERRFKEYKELEGNYQIRRDAIIQRHARRN